MATRILPKTELRDRIRKELGELRSDTLVVTDRGRPIAVAVAVERWNQLQERLEDLEDRIAVLEYRRAPDPGVTVEQALSPGGDEEHDAPGSARRHG